MVGYDCADCSSGCWLGGPSLLMEAGTNEVHTRRCLDSRMNDGWAARRETEVTADAWEEPESGVRCHLCLT